MVLNDFAKMKPLLAVSVSKASGPLVEVSRVRKIFPEQWLWFNATAK